MKSRIRLGICLLLLSVWVPLHLTMIIHRARLRMSLKETEATLDRVAKSQSETANLIDAFSGLSKAAPADLHPQYEEINNNDYPQDWRDYSLVGKYTNDQRENVTVVVNLYTNKAGVVRPLYIMIPKDGHADFEFR